MRRDLLRPVTLDVRDNLLEALVGNHQRFLAFLERRVGSRETAEDILQDGFVRALERADSLRAEESAVAWFYRLLRNALVDYYRRRTTEDRALAAAATEAQEADPDLELRETICACVRDLVETLKPEYRDALRRVELEGEKVDAFAREAGISATNASVRLHRAREKLRRRLLETCGTCVTHGCRSCECGEPRSLIRRSP
jgi:RNA polymerase sigma-70 factor (ECF subfamily)